MTTKWGYALSDWNKAKEEMREALIARAKERGMITYGDLVSKVRSISFDAHDYALGHMLGEISAEEHAAKHGMLSVLVVHKYGDMEPGSGFFEFAEELGFDVADKTEFWVNELKKVYAYWST